MDPDQLQAEPDSPAVDAKLAEGVQARHAAHKAPLRALDLFCGGGGASRGLSDAGFEVTGVDWLGQPYYPYTFRHAHVTRLPVKALRAYDLIWASPPCQRYSNAGHAWGNNHEHPDLVGEVRDLLLRSGVPYIMENVPQAPLREDIMLCGSMFPLPNGGKRRLVRHRIFECEGFHPARLPHWSGDHHWKYITVAGSTGGMSGRTGSCGRGHIGEWHEAMGIDWLPMRSLNQAIPPMYSEYLAREFLNAVL